MPQRCFQILQELTHVRFGCIPGAHQSPGSVRAYVIVKSPASFMEFAYCRIGNLGKDRISFPWIEDLDFGQGEKPFLQSCCH